MHALREHGVHQDPDPQLLHLSERPNLSGDHALTERRLGCVRARELICQTDEDMDDDECPSWL